jgi:hypothetical protein
MVMADTVKMIVPIGSPKCTANASACNMARKAHVKMQIKIQPVQSKFAPPVMGPAGDQCERANAPVANPSSTGISCIHTDFLEGKPAMCDEVLDME